MNYDTIIDCYTDEPSGLGVPPYLSTHSRYIAGWYEKNKKKYFYLTIDDLRFSSGEKNLSNHNINKRINNLTNNKLAVKDILLNSNKILIVMGCFVKYNYISAEPPSFFELNNLLSEFKSEKILFYILGGINLDKNTIENTIPKNLFKKIIYGHGYNYLENGNIKDLKPNYNILSKISFHCSKLTKQISKPKIVEIETSSGCNRTPGCIFCIESIRNIQVSYREVDDILNEIISLYKNGFNYFRLGKQPNFYNYMDSNPFKIEELLYNIRSKCPNIKMLHIDNVNPQSVLSKNGKLITKLIIKYCTSGNIAPFGVESFDPDVRKACNLNGTNAQILNAIEIINNLGGSKIGIDGFPIFLPGINLIFGLPGQSKKTFDYNMKYLDQIYKSGLMVRRLFIRKLTSPYGEAFDNISISSSEEMAFWKKEITRNFEIPMLKRVFPINQILKNLRVEIITNNTPYLRQLATCPIRVIIENKKLEHNNFYNVKVKGYYDNRTLKGIII